MARSRFLPEPDALDRTIMRHLACRVGTNDPVVMVYDLGNLNQIPMDELQPLTHLLFHVDIAAPNHLLVIYSNLKERYILQVQDPQLIVPSLLIAGERRRLRSVHVTDLHGTAHVYDLPALPDPGVSV